MENTSKTPLVSVVMSVYNTKDAFLREAIDSILDQTLSDLEFIIIDDGSEKLTSDVLKSYQDSRIVLITNSENMGITHNLNVGLDKARGKYVARMDADDVSAPDRLDKMISYMESNSEVNVLGSYAYIGRDKIRNEYVGISRAEREVLFILNNVGPIHPTVVFRKRFLDDNDIRYNESYRYAQDYDMWVRCNRLTDIVFYPEPLLYRREHDGQVAKRDRSAQNHIAAEIRSNLLQKIAGDIDRGRILQMTYAMTNGGMRYPEYSSILRTLYKNNQRQSVYDSRILKIVFASYRTKYFHNNTDGFLRRICLIGLVINGQYIIYRLSERKYKSNDRKYRKDCIDDGVAFSFRNE